MEKIYIEGKRLNEPDGQETNIMWTRMRTSRESSEHDMTKINIMKKNLEFD